MPWSSRRKSSAPAAASGDSASIPPEQASDSLASHGMQTGSNGSNTTVSSGSQAGTSADDAEMAMSEHSSDVSNSSTCRCGKALPSKMKVCQSCWFQNASAAASLGHLAKAKRESLGQFTRANREETRRAVRQARGQMFVTVNSALMRGPSRPPNDPDGCGLVLNEEGVVVSLVPGGMAYRWEEFRVGDELLAISGQPFVKASSISDYLVPGKDAYLCEVRRDIRQPTFPSLALSGNSLAMPRYRFNTEAEATEALAVAGDFQKGLKGKSRSDPLPNFSSFSSAKRRTN